MTWPVTDETVSIVPATFDLQVFLSRPKMPLVRARGSSISIRPPSVLSMHSDTSAGGRDRRLAMLRDVAGHERFGHDVLGADLVADLDQNLAGDRQQSAHLVRGPAGHGQSWCVCGGHL